MGKELKDFRIDVIVNLYLLGVKDLNCYATPSKNGEVWFVKQKGQILGKLFSWVENNEGVFMMFKVNDDFNAKGYGTSYYIFLEDKIVSWDYVKRQLDERRRSEMSFYEKWFEDLETSLINYKNEIVNSAKSGLYWGLGIGAVFLAGKLYYNLSFKPRMQSRAYGYVIKDAIKELKK